MDREILGNFLSHVLSEEFVLDTPKKIGDRKFPAEF